MNPYVHELRHLLRSRAMIALLAVTILGGAVAYPTVGGTFVNVSGNGFWYESGGSFHVDLWAEDGAGNPTHGVVVEIRVVEPPAFNGTGSSALVLDSTGVTNDQGEVTFQIPDHLAPSAQYLATLSATDPNPVFLVSGGALATTVSLVNQSTTLPQSLSTPFTTVAQGFYSAHLRLQVVWGGPGGGAPIGDRAVACDVPVNWSTGYYNAATNCTSAARITALGALTGYSTFLPLPPSPPPTGNRSTFWIQLLAIENPNGSVLVSVYSPEYPPYGAGPPLPVGTGASPGASILAAFAFELSFLLPLLALMVTYWVYAGPRLRGTTESLLARPVTRRGLFLVRYGTIVLTLVVAVVAEVLLLEAEVVGILNEPLPPSFLEGMAGGLAVAALGMVGLAFLSAHAFRSSGAVLGVGLAVVLVTSVFWELIPAALRALFGNALAPEAYSALILRSELFAPSQIPILVVGDLTGAAFFGPSTSLAAVGITEGVIGAAAVLWVAVPFLLTYWRVVTRD